MQFEELLESLPEVVFETDLEGNLVYVNSQGFKLFGYSRREFEKGLNGIKMIVPQDRSRVKENFQKIIKRQNPRLHEYTVQKRDGSLCEVLIKSRRIVRGGEVVGFRGLLIDNSHRKRVQKSLLLKSKMIDCVDDAIITTEPEGKILYWNKAAENLFGWSSKEVLGVNIFNVTVPKISQQKAHDIMENLRNGKSWKGEFEVRRKDGSCFLGEVVDSPVFDSNGNLIGIIGATRDLTGQKLKENQLRESEEKFKVLAEQSPNMIFINQKGKVAYANKKCEEVTGYTKDEFYDPSFDFVCLIAPQDKEKVMKNFCKHMNGEDVPPVEYSIVSKHGDAIEGILLSKLILYGGEQAVLGTITDITQYKRAEEKIEAMVKGLQIVNEKLNIVGKSTRHDAANKLAVILNNVYLAKMRLPENQVEIRKYLLGVENAVVDINRIFDFSRVFQQLGSEKLEEIDVGEVFENAVSSFLKRKDDLLILNDCKGLKLFADSLLETLFYNLVENSLKHEKKVTSLALHYADLDNELVVFYEDNGIGIDETEKEKVFTEGYGKGTGIGLHLVRLMCNVYGWSIKETGVPMKGVQFSITVPKKLVPVGEFRSKVGFLVK